MTADAMSVIWHDLECGGYAEDLPLWRSLARRARRSRARHRRRHGPCRARPRARGYRVTALDHDPGLLAELARRADGLLKRSTTMFGRCTRVRARRAFRAVHRADADDPAARRQPRHADSFLGCARRHLLDGGVIAIAITETLELFDVGDGSPAPLPDICELDGVVYSSQPTAVRVDRDGFVLERRRETITVRRAAHRRARPDAASTRLTAAQLERRGGRRSRCGRPSGSRSRRPLTTSAAQVVILRA